MSTSKTTFLSFSQNSATTRSDGFSQTTTHTHPSIQPIISQSCGFSTKVHRYRTSEKHKKKTFHLSDCGWLLESGKPVGLSELVQTSPLILLSSARRVSTCRSAAVSNHSVSRDLHVESLGDQQFLDCMYQPHKHLTEILFSTFWCWM